MRYIVIILLLTNSLAYGLGDVNFYESNDSNAVEKYSIKFTDQSSEKAAAILDLFRENYENLKPSKMAYSQSPIIPKVIHAIWIGDKPLPDNYQYYLLTWKKYNPDWEIKLWNEADIIQENFPSMDLYWLAQSYPEKSDIARYEIIKKYGGLYIDSDIECFSNLDELNYKYDFYANLETPCMNRRRVSVINAMFAATPNHPIIIETLKILRQNWNKASASFAKDSDSSKSFKRSKQSLAVQRTMFPLGEAIYNFLKTPYSANYKSIVLPAGYNFPHYCETRQAFENFFKKMLSIQISLGTKNIIQPETLSFHFFDKENSLMQKTPFLKIYKTNFITKLIVKYLTSKDKYFLELSQMYDKLFPTNISYSINAKIPEIIYLDNNNDLTQQELLDLKDQWQKMNPFFTVKLVEELDYKVPKDLLPFYILSDNGGVYVKSDFKPANLQEFNYKYSFYGVLEQPNSIFDKISLDTSLIASKANHSIISHLIQDSKTKSLAIQDLYMENIYKYNQLDGRNIVFPASVFDQKRRVKIAR